MLNTKYAAVSNENDSQIEIYDETKLDISTPVLILGGKENSLSIVRRFGKLGIKTSVSGPADCWGLYSKYCAQSLPIPKHLDQTTYWSDLLLNTDNENLHGSLIICCSDIAIEFVAANHKRLGDNYLLDKATSDQQSAMLDKRKTLELAREAGVDTPQFWNVETEQDLAKIKDEIQFPVMVKPILSHNFSSIFGKKLFIIENSFDELIEKVKLSWKNNLEVMVIEMIPGPDDLLSSYYTYIDDENNTLFNYTKRIIRRYPLNHGLACYHASEWLPETADAGHKFFTNTGFKGIGNIEFKRDIRDNKLKVIECNARFTAGQALVVQSGAPIDLILYCSITNQPFPTFDEYKQGMTYWYGLRDFLAFLQLNRMGKLSFVVWLKSLWPMNHVAPLHSITDPYPTFGALNARLGKLLKRLR